MLVEEGGLVLLQVSCELGQDQSVAEVVGEVRLAATGELLSHVAAAANRSALEIAGLSPGEVSILSVPIQTLFPLLLFFVVIPHFLPELWIFPEAGRQVTFLCSAQLELLLQLHNYLSELGPAAAAASHNTAAMFILQIKHTSAVGSSR